MDCCGHLDLQVEEWAAKQDPKGDFLVLLEAMYSEMVWNLAQLSCVILIAKSLDRKKIWNSETLRFFPGCKYCLQFHDGLLNPPKKMGQASKIPAFTFQQPGDGAPTMDPSKFSFVFVSGFLRITTVERENLSVDFRGFFAGWSVYQVVVSFIFFIFTHLGRWSSLIDIFQMGWNHQLFMDV